MPDPAAGLWPLSLALLSGDKRVPHLQSVIGCFGGQGVGDHNSWIISPFMTSAPFTLSPEN